jgi:ABC-type transporter Mla subunit MlaD
MREQLQARLDELKRQFEAGQTELQQLQAHENYLRETMLRISGAMQVLEELLAEAQPTEENDTGPNKAEPVTTQTNGLDA